MFDSKKNSFLNGKFFGKKRAVIESNSGCRKHVFVCGGFGLFYKILKNRVESVKKRYFLWDILCWFLSQGLLPKIGMILRTGISGRRSDSKTTAISIQ